VDPVVPAEWNPPSDQDRRRVEIGSKVCHRAAVLTRVGVIRFVAFLLTSGAKRLASSLVRLISSVVSMGRRNTFLKFTRRSLKT
jgi:hypothetical protein